MGRARKIKVHIVDDIFEELTVYPCSKIVKSSGPFGSCSIHQTVGRRLEYKKL